MTHRYSKVTSKGNVIEKSGWHNPNNSGCMFVSGRSCGCKTKEGNKGTYRDVTAKQHGKTYHFYHQTAVVIEEKQYYQLNNGGYKTRTTKERINRYIPSPWYVQQIDFEWFLINKENDEKIPFENGMIIDAKNNKVLEE